jgi:hypothetical protein
MYSRAQTQLTGWQLQFTSKSELHEAQNLEIGRLISAP